MILKNLKLNNFRNYEKKEVEFSPEINLIYGNNGSGKTNILEAISVISNLKSFRNVSDQNMVKWDSEYYYCRGEVLMVIIPDLKSVFIRNRTSQGKK